MTFAELLNRLDKVRGGRNGQYAARCPAHDDKGPSLGVRDVGDGRILVHCFAGCETEDVLAAVGLTFSDLMRERVGTAHSFRPYIDKGRILSVVADELRVLILIAEEISDWLPAEQERLLVSLQRIRQAQQVFPDRRRAS